MKNVKFKRLVMSDWRAQNKTIDFGGERTLISGRNASGKSSVWDAVLWLFTGYDSQNRMNYQLFDNRVVPTKENSKPAAVELVFTVDGIEYRLKRTAEMGWVRPRGASNYEKKPSDDYKFEIDGVAVPVSEYKSFVESTFCPIEKLKFILNTDFFLGMDWKELRKHFADIIGEVKEEDYSGDFSAVVALVNRYGSMESAKEHLKTRRSVLRDEIGDGNRKGTKVVELDTLRGMLPDISGVAEARKTREESLSKISVIDAEISGRAASIEPMLHERNRQLAEIAEMEAALNAAKYTHESAHSAELRAVKSEIEKVDADNAEIEKKNKEARKKIEDAERGIESLSRKLETSRAYREELLRQNAEVKSMQFSEDKCPYCGQELPADKLEEAKARFDAEKEAKHKRIVAAGQANNADIKKCEEEMAALEDVVSWGASEIPQTNKSDLESKLADLTALYVPYEELDEYKAKAAEIAQKRAKIADIPSVDTSDLEEQKAELYGTISECSEIIAREETYNTQTSKIAALEEDIRKSANELAEIEGVLALFDERERQKAEIIRTRVSSLFELCEVHMEERKKDGTMTPACNILINGVIAQVANTASKIKVGADISNAFAKHYGLNMPLIVDNRERVDSSVDFAKGRQLVEMKVSDNDFNVEAE